MVSYARPGKPVTCSGRLTIQADGSWLEHIDNGHCDDLGVWVFSQGGGVLHGTYRPPVGGHYVLSLDLIPKS